MAPAPGRMPMMVPTTEHLATIHFTDRNSFRLGSLADMLLFPPTAVSLEGLAVCFSTSVTAKKPIITGIISMPEVRSLVPKVSLGTPSRGSRPMQAKSSPSRPEMMVRQMLSVSRLVRMDRPMKEMAKSSEGPKLRAAWVSWGLKSSMQTAANIPPMAEQTSCIPRAFPASPLWAMG